MVADADLYRFGPFTLDRAAYRLRRGDRVIVLAPKTLDLLFLLVTRPALLVTKDDIHFALWPDVAVTDNALTQVISELRQALGDSPSSPAYVETVPRRGYRFIAEVEVERAAPSAPASAGEAPPRTIAVLDFFNVSGDAGIAWLAAGIAETVSNDLRAIAALRVIDRAFLPKLDASALASAATTDAAASLDLVVMGSYQRIGEQLRITARVVDVRTRSALAKAKADGRVEDVFGLQDRLVLQLSAELRLPVTSAANARITARETSSVEAYRALTEGRLKLERLDPALIPGALADFERALALDPQYALAHIGVAHAHFWRFQASRARNQPDAEALGAAITHARRAAELDAGLAEAHAALALFLASANRPLDAVAAGRLAVALEPGNWRHLFRLGIAAWGDERLRALDVVIAAYPTLAYAYFATAMVHVARRDLPRAAEVLRRGMAAAPDRSAGAERFPGQGLHWLLGLIRLAEGDPEDAIAEFDRELHAPGSGLYADEFAMDAHDGYGFVRLDRGDATGAAAMFTQALDRFPMHARSLVGLALAQQRIGRAADGKKTIARAMQAIEELRSSGRSTEASLALAFAYVVSGRNTDALATLEELLRTAPPGLAGWTLPIEPLLAPLRGEARFQSALADLNARTRV